MVKGLCHLVLMAVISGCGSAGGSNIGSPSLSGPQPSASVPPPIVLTSLRIEPPAALSAPGTSRQFRAIGTFSDSSQVDLTESVNWQSSNAGNATVSNAAGERGRVSVVGEQLELGITITATHPNLLQPANAELTVNRLVIISHLASDIVSFRSDLPNGQLTFKSQANGAAESLALDATGRFLYALGAGLVAYRLDSLTGQMTQIAVLQAGTEPRALAFSPDQGYIYVANGGSVGTLGISVYRRSRDTGAVTAMGNFDSTRRINDVAVHPNGSFAFGLFSDPLAIEPSAVRVYSRDTNTGQLSFLQATPTTSSPLDLAISPDGEFLYLVDNQSLKLSAFGIDAQTGQLTPVAGGPFNNSDNSYTIAIHPSGRFIYTGSAILIDLFSRDATTGELVHLAAFPTGGQCSSISIDPTGRFLYATSESEHPALPDDVTTYRIDTDTGLLGDRQQFESGNQATGSICSP